MVIECVCRSLARPYQGWKMIFLNSTHLPPLRCKGTFKLQMAVNICIAFKRECMNLLFQKQLIASDGNGNSNKSSSFYNMLPVDRAFSVYI